MEELPEYRVRSSGRARRVLLTIRPRRGLEVVIPAGFDPARVPDIVRRRLPWIEKHLSRLAVPGPEAVAASSPPGTVSFPLAGQVLAVGVARRAARSVRVVENAGTLLLSGPVEDAPAWRRALREYLRRRAAGLLPARLAELAADTGLSYEAAGVRFQRGRWGSCSVRGVISLNARLLFLPVPLVDYVLLHELCHTRQHNHGPEFWRLVARFSPDWKALEAGLRQAWRHIPAWADASGDRE